MPDETALAVATAAPALTPADLAQRFTTYRGIQTEIDRALPDAIMTIGDRQYRKRAYWRAVAVAFDLVVEPVEERREIYGTLPNGADNFGYLVTYRATARNGRSVIGDGACFAIEKINARGAAQATEHNVRAHAHTRAFNRAISNLVGFGEVSAEEIEDSDRDRRQPPRQHGTPPPPVAAPTGPPRISDAQRKRLFAIAREHGRDHDAVKAILRSYGIEHSDEIPRDRYDAICASLAAVDVESTPLPADREPGSDDVIDGEVDR